MLNGNFKNSNDFTKIGYILSHIRNINKFKRTDTTQYLLSDHSGIKLEFSNRKITEKFPNILRSYNTLLNNSWIKKKTQETF